MQTPIADATPRLRAALLAWWLAHGEAMTAEQIAKLLNQPEQQATRLMHQLAQVLPVEQDAMGFWARVQGNTTGARGDNTRSAYVAWLLANGAELTVMQVAQQLAIGRRAAHYMLVNLSIVLPIYDYADPTRKARVWRVCSDVFDADDESDEWH